MNGSGSSELCERSLYFLSHRVFSSIPTLESRITGITAILLRYTGNVSAEQEKTFYLETFGCQMNVHDSEKVIGTLVHQGYRQVQTVEEAGLVLYNTCSIRDKAEQKVFHRLNDYKKLQAQGKKFGVLGCVAQQEGEAIFKRSDNPISRYERVIAPECDMIRVSVPEIFDQTLFFDHLLPESSTRFEIDRDCPVAAARI